MLDIASLRQRLEQGLEELDLHLDNDIQVRLLEFVSLLSKWNRAYNLTAIRDPEQMVTLHILDSLVVLHYLHGDRIIDVGTGGGLPGIPLALVAPDKSFTLLDSNGKKTRFLVQAVAELGLSNVTVVHSRVDQYRPGFLFDTVITRAFASLADMLPACRHLLGPKGRFLAMKGAYPAEELREIPSEFSLLDTVPLAVPGLAAERHLVRLTVSN